MKKANGKRDQQNDRFVRLGHGMLKGNPWLSLSGNAKALYVGIAERYNGRNNGDIPFSRREASDYLKVGAHKAVAAFKELQEAGLITIKAKGWIRPDFQKAARWQINEYAKKEQNCKVQLISNYRSLMDQ
jgi:hypothetical protein